MMTTINFFCSSYEGPTYQLHLVRLYADLGDRDADAWAKELYLTLRRNPMNERASALNLDRKFCLSLIYEMVDAWEDSADPDLFEEEIFAEFGIDRLRRILYICVVMDRAQSLYRMQVPSSRSYGMHWYCKLHLDNDSVFARTFPGKYKQLQEALKSYMGSATMNRRLFKLMNTPRFGLVHDHSLSKWCLPAIATFVEEIESSSILPGRHLKTDKESNDALVEGFVDAYNDLTYQERLTRLYHDRASRDPEEWSRENYISLRDDNDNPRVMKLDEDCKECLKLLYNLVDCWESNQFSSAFEQSIHKVFKTRRIARILGVCLVMDRARALYKMILPATTSDGQIIIGMHWYSDLHFQKTALPTEDRIENLDLHVQNKILDSEVQSEWEARLKNYSGRATCNERLYRLLHSDLFGLQKDALFAKWSKPEAAEFVYRRAPSSSIAQQQTGVLEQST